MPKSHKIVPTRIVIYAKDVMNITGRSERTSRKILQQIRQATGKKRGDMITVLEFCQHTGIDQHLVTDFLL
ncbi:hypothetical protein CLV59_108196 [Chitinophaga dinghuensis]|uniref:Uncharacterized protein n=1 Tax=Chitinophaga dinghuensis TaxID=1539050 RepID=A0A327VQD9_9BACT|nr:hypothetical protein [Chitinophaga dinghuensis]RAJ76676.1 hypothetical protein CLV59_108196 [Chitinophaga dinghuensis]